MSDVGGYLQWYSDDQVSTEQKSVMYGEKISSRTLSFVVIFILTVMGLDMGLTVP